MPAVGATTFSSTKYARAVVAGFVQHRRPFSASSPWSPFSTSRRSAAAGGRIPVAMSALPPSHELFFVLDATSFLYRAFYSKYELQGFDTEMPLILLGNAFAELMKTQRPAFVAAAFDGPRDSVFRRELFPAYKRNRDEQPVELLALVPKAIVYLQALGCKGVYRSEAHEGDDLMATLRDAARLKAPGLTTVLVTEDKDLLSLVDAKTLVLHPRTLEVFDAARVEQKLGVPPHLVCDLMALAGDAVDGIPGVKGVGPQTAVRLLKAFGSLENLYANLDGVATVPNLRGAKTLGEKLRKQQEDVFLYRQVVTLACDVDLPGLHSMPMEELRYTGVDELNGDALLEEAMGAPGVGRGPYVKLLKDQQKAYVPF